MATPTQSVKTSRAGTQAQELIVLCAGNNYDTVRVLDQHMADRLGRLAPVLYVDPPLSHLSPRHNAQLAPALQGPRLRRMPPGFWRLTPVVTPFPMRPGLSSLTQYLVRRALSRAVRTIGLDVQAVVSAWPWLDIFGACNERLRVWWAQDDNAAGAELMGHAAGRIAAGENARIRQSDLIIAATPELDRRMRSEGHDVELIANGADPESFSQVGETAIDASLDLKSPVAIVVGQLNSRIDPGLLEAVVDRGVSLLIVGPAVEGQADWLPRLCSRSNVKWVGRQPFDALPGLLGQASVGLVPYADTAFNRASFPLKALEYLSAGLPVVATDLPFTRWLGAPPSLVSIANQPAAFGQAVAAAAAVPSTVALREGRRAFARAHSYEQRARDMLDAIGKRVA
jgi:teichuronic acid biosynthesis glycosyltransferase TuaH